jgi:hypothetical protein
MKPSIGISLTLIPVMYFAAITSQDVGKKPSDWVPWFVTTSVLVGLVGFLASRIENK